MDDVRLAQPYEAMFERNIGHFAKRGREVEVWVEGVPTPKIGFVAGMDDEFLQVCISKNANLSSIRRDLIASIEETGVSIGNLITSTRGTEEEVLIDRIREKINAFQKRASRVMARST